MARELHSALPPAPRTVVAPDGTARTGAFHGSFDEVDLRPLLGRGLRAKALRFVKLKQWQYGVIATPEVLVAFALVDVGYTANCFAFAVDLVEGKLLADQSYLGLPIGSVSMNGHPGEGSRTTFRALGCSARVVRPTGTPAYQIDLAAGPIRLEAMLDTTGAPPPLAVVMPVVGGHFSATQKGNLLAATGTLRIGRRTFALGGGFGGLDFTHGLLARDTSWRWGFGLGRASDGRAVGFNLAEGLTDATKTENAVWVGGELVPVGAPRFTFDTKDPQGPWQVRTDDGAVDLRFTAKGMHREDRNLGLVVSHFAQVAGTFTGTLRDAAGKSVAVDGLPGVTEDQRVRW